MKPTTLSSFIVITQTLLNHVVTADLQVHRIECMRNEEPHCCEEPCGWQQENITEDGDCEVFGHYMTCLFDKETRNLTIPSKLIKTAARCKIHKKKQNFHMSCYHDDKPICCDTPCECDLNLLNATCTMQEKSMECSCAGSGSADNPVLNFCFKNTCLKGCDFQAGVTCYISTGVTDGKGQKQESKQVSDEDKKEMKDNNVTEPEPGLSPGAVAGIVVGVLVLVAAAAAAVVVVGVIYYRRKISELRKQILTVTVTVREGEPVILKHDKEIKKDDLIQWMFGEGEQQTPIAEFIGKTREIVTHDNAAAGRFRDRLDLDKKTRSLIIKNSTTADSGLYTRHITSSRVASEQRFILTVNENAEEISVEGDSVTLYPDPLKPDTGIQRDDQILWTFGDQDRQDRLIAEISRGTGKTCDAAAGIFRGRLELNKTTGSLTITHIRAQHTGRYKLQIISSRGTFFKKFWLFMPLRRVYVTAGDPVQLSTGLPEIERDDVIEWRFGDGSLIAEIKGGTGETYDGPDKRFRDRLVLDNQTGDLTIKNSTTEHAGRYKLKIRSGKGNTNKTYIVAITFSTGTRESESVSVEMRSLLHE